VATFEARIKVKALRNMLRTANHYLGMGPKSIEVGDMLWLLCGARCSLYSSSNGQYWMIGKAYIHGILRCEALAGKSDFQTVILE
jgi:hypothetical protein